MAADNFKDFFSGKLASLAYREAKRAISDYSMDEKIRAGVLVGLSGGADSVMLLRFLLKYRSECGDFPLLAVHINHMIRDDEAQRDEDFSNKLCEKLGVEFMSVKIDIPTLSKSIGKSIEEAARNARYSAFAEIISGRKDINTIAVAHNADDNFETVIINMMRGAGTLGMAGINPVRDNIIRPLIYLKKSDIVEALLEEKEKFVTDSTNESDDYTRNYIRHNILPAFFAAYPEAHASVMKMCENLRKDEACLLELAENFAEKYENGKIPKCELSNLSPALLFRVLKIYFKSYSKKTLERVHIEATRECLLRDGDFSVSLPGEISFFAAAGFCGFSYNKVQRASDDFIFEISDNVTEIPEFSALVQIGSDAVYDNSSKVYNISTQANLASAIIKGKLYIRNKREGDSYFYGGITRKLKKLFNDKKIPVAKREKIPVICDDAGIVWVPGFGVRDDGGTGKSLIRIYTNTDSQEHFYLPCENKKERLKVRLLNEG